MELPPFTVPVPTGDAMTVRLLTTDEVAERFRTSPPPCGTGATSASDPPESASAAAFSTTRPNAIVGGSRRSPPPAGTGSGEAAASARDPAVASSEHRQARQRD